MRSVTLLVMTAVTLALPAHAALAAWPGDPYIGNVPVSTATGVQSSVQSCSDGAGGAFLVWQDSRSGNADIYAQRIDASGVALWSSNGVPVCTATGNQSAPQLAPDGFGGIAVVWSDFRSGVTSDIYAQRINGSGTALWGTNGIAVCTASQDQTGPMLAVEASGELTIAWNDLRNISSFDIYAQRMNSSGVALWGANGMALCTAANTQSGPRVVQAAPSSMIVFWDDTRSGTADIYAQRVSGAGSLQWAADGLAICAEAGAQTTVSAIPDGSGGALLAWQDSRSGNLDIYCQRINNSGVSLWSATGTPVSVAASTQASVVVASDGSGGMMLAWVDVRTSPLQIYAQRMSASGAALWTVDGVALRNLAAGTGNNPRIAADGARGAIVAWEDTRAGNIDVYAQRLTAQGTQLWAGNGALVSGAYEDQFGLAIVPDGDAGAIVAWTDERNGGAADDIYCQRVERYGQLGEPQAVITGVRDVANDQGGRVRVSWSASDLDVEPEFGIYDYRLWRQVPASLAAARALREGMTSDPDAAAARGQLWFGAQAYAWELVTSQLGNALSDYSLTTTTASDSVAGSNPHTVFMVESRATDSPTSDRWYSAPDSGYSVDDLAPAAPAPLTGFFAGGATRLAWNPNAEADLAGYRLYRGGSAGFVPGPSNLVTAQPDTGYIDVAGAPFIYKLAAVDVHGNESPVAVLVPTGVLGTDPATTPRLEFAGLSPQPLRGEGSVQFTLSRAGAIALRVLDVTGREVATLARGEHAAGEHRVAWDGRSVRGARLAAGMYFLRLETAEGVLTRRAILSR